MSEAPAPPSARPGSHTNHSAPPLSRSPSPQPQVRLGPALHHVLVAGVEELHQEQNAPGSDLPVAGQGLGRCAAFRRVPQGQEPLCDGLGQAHQDGTGRVRHPGPPPQGARRLLQRHGRLGAGQHGLHGAARTVGGEEHLREFRQIHLCCEEGRDGHDGVGMSPTHFSLRSPSFLSLYPHSPSSLHFLHNPSLHPPSLVPHRWRCTSRSRGPT